MNFPNPEDYIAYIRSADWLLVLFYGFLVAATTYSMVLAVKAFRHRITWGQARRMGVPFAIFVWLQAIFYFVVFDGAYGIVSIVLATPLWLDLLISAITIIAVGILFFILQRRPKFKPHLFIPLVLIPLGIPGTHLVAKLVRVGAIEVAPVGALMALKHGDTVAEVLGDYADDISIHIPLVRSIPKATETVIGQITFLTTVGKGVLGDALTARRLTGMAMRSCHPSMMSCMALTPFTSSGTLQAL